VTKLKNRFIFYFSVVTDNNEKIKKNSIDQEDTIGDADLISSFKKNRYESATLIVATNLNVYNTLKIANVICYII
jgi:hypothetical protein